MRCQHVSLNTRNLQETHAFYVELLGLPVANYDEARGLLALKFDDGSVLRFERTDGEVSPSGVRFVGIELDSFEEVDRWYERLAGRIPIVQDLRPRYTSIAGPYGFLVRDPNGYAIKLFRYGPRTARGEEGSTGKVPGAPRVGGL